MKIREQVMAFHKAMDIPSLDRPQVPHPDRVRLRMRIITEEYFEAMRAVFVERLPAPGSEGHEDCAMACAESILMTLISDDPIKVDMVELADALGDIDYVVEGTRQEFGIDGEPVANEIQRTNMAKVGGPKRASDGKQMKPPGWTPPDIATVLVQQGWGGT